MKKTLIAALSLLSFTAQCGVTIYENSYFLGRSAYIADGELIDGLKERGIFENDSVSSLKVDWGSCAVLYQNSGFNGNVIFVGGGEYIDLSLIPFRFNDETSSIQVFTNGTHFGDFLPCNNSVMTIFYRDANYTNIAFSLPPNGSFLRDLATGNWNRHNGRLQHANDSISSVRVPSGRCVTLHEHPNFQGASSVISSNTPDLVPLNFNDKTSSVQFSQCE
jgi:hypothetical protein